MGFLAKNQLAHVAIKKSQIKRMQSLLKKSPEKLRLYIRREWTDTIMNFVQLMRDKHLSGGTTATRLNRITSDLYNSLYGETYNGRNFVDGRTRFLPSVLDYAPSHEYGDASRGIPARMGLRKEWKKYEKKFITSANRAARKLEKDFN